MTYKDTYIMKNYQTMLIGNGPVILTVMDNAFQILCIARAHVL